MLCGFVLCKWVGHRNLPMAHQKSLSAVSIIIETARACAKSINFAHDQHTPWYYQRKR